MEYINPVQLVTPSLIRCVSARARVCKERGNLPTVYLQGTHTVTVLKHTHKRTQACTEGSGDPVSPLSQMLTRLSISDLIGVDTENQRHHSQGDNRRKLSPTPPTPPLVSRERQCAAQKHSIDCYRGESRYRCESRSGCRGAPLFLALTSDCWRHNGEKADYVWHQERRRSAKRQAGHHHWVQTGDADICLFWAGRT